MACSLLRRRNDQTDLGTGPERHPPSGRGAGPGGQWVQGGPIARYVEDLALVLPLLAGPAPGDPYAIEAKVRDTGKVSLEQLKVAFFKDNGFVSPTTEIQDTVTKAAQSLTRVTSRVEERRPPLVDESYDIMVAAMSPGAEKTVRSQLQADGTKEVSPLMEGYFRLVNEFEKARIVAGKPIDRDAVDDQWRTHNQGITSFMTDYDVILCPVNAFPAMKHAASWDHAEAFSYTVTWNLTGHPAAVVRCGTTSNGLPIGVQIVGHPFREDVVLAVAGCLEKNFGGWKPPPL